MFAIGFAFFGNTVDAGKNNSTVQPTLLGPQSRFGDKLFGIWLVCLQKQDCNSKRG